MDQPSIPAAETTATQPDFPQPPQPTPPPLLRWPLAFHGKGGEYFRIWVVNLMLSYITLGIYSAWAKVRKLKYLYGNTELAGARFDYTANPRHILLGRVVAAVFFGIYMLLSQIHPLTSLLAILLLWLALPWLIVRSLAFNLRHTRYRNVRFGFVGTVWGGYKHFLFLPMLLLPSLGLAYPYVRHQQMLFLINNLRFGNQSFTMQPAVGNFFLTYLVTMAALGGLVTVLMLVALPFSVIGVGLAEALDIPLAVTSAIAIIMVVVGYLLFGLIYAVALQAMRMALANTVWGNTRVADCQVESKVPLLGYLGLLCTRLPLLVVTLGLATPWVVVTLIRYRLQHMALLAPNDLAGFEAAVASYGNVAGSEAGELFDLDLAL